MLPPDDLRFGVARAAVGAALGFKFEPRPEGRREGQGSAILGGNGLTCQGHFRNSEFGGTRRNRWSFALSLKIVEHHV